MIAYLLGAVIYYFAKTAMVSKLRPYVGRPDIAMVAAAIIWPISAAVDFFYLKEIRNTIDNSL